MPVRRKWQALRINIYNSYIQIGCGGFGRQAVVEAFPFLQEFVRKFNISFAHLDCNASVIPPEGGRTYYTIMPLKDLSFKAAEFLMEMLYNDNWELEQTKDYRDGPFTQSSSFFETYLLLRVYMHRF